MRVLIAAAIAASSVMSGVVEAAEPELIALGTGKKYRFKGFALDARSGEVYLGSWDQKQIVAVELKSKKHRVVSTKYSGKLNAMGVFLRGGELYVVMNEVDDRPDARALSVLVVIERSTLKVLRAYELRATKSRHHFNHVVVDAAGLAYISDTLHASIYTVDTTDPRAGFELLVKHEELERVHGIDLHGSKLFATSYAGGIRVFDLRKKELTAYRDPATAGDDGLKYHAGHLYGLGRDTLRKYRLNAAEDAVTGTEVLLRDHPAFDDPRCLHIEDGHIYVLANRDQLLRLAIPFERSP